MVYAQIETSVARKRKQLQAGPAACWLWVLGLLYAQDELSDGYIPIEALPYLGVPQQDALNLAPILVKVGLWHEVEGGYQIHDYLDYNKSANEIHQIRAIKRGNGRLGGIKSGARRKQVLEAPASSTCFNETEAAAQPSSTTATATATPTASAAAALPHTVAGADVAPAAAAHSPAASVLPFTASQAPRLDLWLRQVQATYPKHRVTSGARTEHAWVALFASEAPRAPAEVFEEVLDNLAANVASHEWRVRGFVPSLEKYLRDGLWRQRHDAMPATAAVGTQTARTLVSAAAFATGGGS